MKRKKWRKIIEEEATLFDTLFMQVLTESSFKHSYLKDVLADREEERHENLLPD